ncbi:preprotein translocase subunit SecE [Romboutsia sp.]|uniref:preprotein translocase subunit SecE n=1 Tax=Romboutsia sp. TaxID=1965302 RepID=UPI002BE6E8F3|nr:preprotein translocase subunit SecE [Romboutsia sp.]HSQ89422.1 preprotein translocase subunit SecE [Romboutsia sp.]
MSAQVNQGIKTKKNFSLVSYVKETKQELKRVSWPTKKELLKNTGVVLTVVISSTILVWVLDSALSGALGLILK